jgi:ATP-dependent Clp protease adaptor protein ClpS
MERAVDPVDQPVKDGAGDSQVETAEDTSTELSPLFKVVLFDDDEHTYDYVVEMLVDCCSLSRESAFRCAVEVDLAGRTTVFFGTLRECRRRCDRIHAFGADPRLPRSRGSMRAEVQER